MLDSKNVFDYLRRLIDTKISQSQVDAGDLIIEKVGVNTLAEFLGMSTGMLTAEKLRKIYPGADTEFVGIINKHAHNFGITSKTRMAMFLAHGLHESAGFNKLAESFNYRPERLLQVFPTRIPNLLFAKQLVAKGQPAIANHLYNNRYGNGGGNDGWNYRGRGIGGTTFKGNYIKLQSVLDKMGLKFNIVEKPELLSDKSVAVLTHMAYWMVNNMNISADKGDVLTSTKIINGGTNGLEERKKLYKLGMDYL